MNSLWKEILWYQVGAAIDTFQNALIACPAELWQASLWRNSKTEPGFAEFWHIAYHTAYWLDHDCSELGDEFKDKERSPNYRILSERGMNSMEPERVYTKQELLTYLEFVRNKCYARIESLENIYEPQRVRENHPVETVAELLLLNLRHIQEHAAHLSMFLGQKTDLAPEWVRRGTNR